MTDIVIANMPVSPLYINTAVRSDGDPTGSNDVYDVVALPLVALTSAENRRVDGETKRLCW